MSTLANTQHNTGIVTKKTTGTYTVFGGDNDGADPRLVSCSLSPRLRHPDGPGRRGGEAGGVVVGDRVRFTEAGGGGTITDVLPRRNQLSRRSAVPMPSAHASEQVIAANMDQVVPVMAAASPAPKWNLLDRYLVSAEAAGLPALVVVTKLDLARDPRGDLDEALQEAVEDYRRIGYAVLLASAVTGEGIQDLREALRGRASVLIGKSGVGKTSLLNALEPGLGLRVREVSRIAGKGRHTTTHLEMFPLDGGGALVDTPGVREFGLWEVEQDDLALFFPEMRPFVGRCRFGMGCRHDEEPGCAVRKAVVAGQISPRRYQSYLRLEVDA